MLAIALGTMFPALAMGATHLTFRTMASGLTSNDQHIEALRRFREVWPS